MAYLSSPTNAPYRLIYGMDNGPGCLLQSMCAGPAMLQEGAHLPYAVAYDKADGVIIVQRGSVALIIAADVDRLRMRAVDSGGVRKHRRRGRQR
uniref:Ragulator complex protein LAMTOR4 n=1 Tax=Elaeophora elaphi TaxID=1147741 RepID=A0A0R3RQL1_9BILA